MWGTHDRFVGLSQSLSTGYLPEVALSCPPVTETVVMHDVLQLTAAAHRDLVRSLVIIEGSPDGPSSFDPDPDGARQIGESLKAWPVPFPDHAAAHSFTIPGAGHDVHLDAPAAWVNALQRSAAR